ncbi:MAG: hypothetical protein ACTSWR_04565 [Candidatus Helarchaeota archaeon]
MKIFLASAFRTEEDQKFLDRIKKILIDDGNVVWCSRDHFGDYYGTTNPVRLKEIVETEKDEILKSDAMIVLLCNIMPEPLMQTFFASEYGIPVIIYINLRENSKSIKLSPWIRYYGQIVKSDNAFLNSLKQIKVKIEKEYL